MKPALSSIRQCAGVAAAALGLTLAACSAPEPDDAIVAGDPSTLPAYNVPLVEHGADPWIHRTEDGHYYFISTAPEFDRIELMESDTLNGFTDAEPKVIWARPDEGPMGGHVWAPELHHIDGVWYVHVALGDADAPFRIRMHVLSNDNADPMTDNWVEEGQIETPWDDFALDATTFVHNGTQYLVWAQRDPDGRYNSALYMAEMPTPTTISDDVMLLTEPEFDWEHVGYHVNEGAAVIKRHGRIFITYSASATDHNYAMGLVWASDDADLMDPASWKKSPEPVFYSNESLERFGPGHNGFTLAEDGQTDLLVYHARSYRELQGSPLTDPNRNARVRVLEWDEHGFPVFHQDRDDNYHRDSNYIPLPGPQTQPDTDSKMNTKPFVSKAPFGELPDGREVTQFTLNNGNGMEVKLINYGGIITHLYAPDRDGNIADVVLGYDDLQSYVDDNPYFGALIGRFGNRIAGGRFELDGEVYQLATNDGDNHLHGGEEGFDKKLWDAKLVSDERGVGVELFLLSEDGDQGYPGNLEVTATYILTPDNEVLTEFRAETDKATPVNLTQHSYFNLAGEGDVLGHLLQINADHYLPVENLIPTGELAPVAGTPFDFTSAKPIGQDIRAEHPQLERVGGGFDHNYVLARDDQDGMFLAARALEPNSGRVLEVLTDEPGIQFYSGNFLDGGQQGKGQSYELYNGFCLEPQHFPDAPNQEHFQSTILRPGEVYEMRMSFRFSVE
ncbi:galactose-1-epimerase [Marinimicrobium alkaliphilum]|uniref:galactose-1-epimerase n=1 Tax=Marinimicrobium alkaliphilum TaxID=2202654 RepID=UPI001E3D97D7|nr:galactose-1-epimerase [Marinimicrobium alkaliphilum]